MSYLGLPQKESTTRSAYAFTATAGQTVFAAIYDSTNIDIFKNGVKLTASQYTATNGTTITLGTPANLNDKIYILNYNQFTFDDTYTQDQITEFNTDTLNLTYPTTETYSLPAVTTSITNTGAYDSKIVFDAIGNMYLAVANYYNGTTYSLTSYVYKITPGGVVSTFASVATNGCQTTALKFDTSGNLYWVVGNSYNGAAYNLTSYVYKITPNGTLTTFASAATLGIAGTSLEFDTSGNLYWAISNYYNGTTYDLVSYIYKITPSGTLTTFVSNNIVGASANTLKFDTSGNLYWAMDTRIGGDETFRLSYVYKITPGGSLTTFANDPNNGSLGAALQFDSSGNLYWSVCAYYNGATYVNTVNYVYKITPAGALTTFAEVSAIGPAGTALEFDSSGNLYWAITSRYDGSTGLNLTSRIHKITPSGTLTTLGSKLTNNGIGTDIKLDSAGNIYWVIANNYDGITYNTPSTISKITKTVNILQPHTYTAPTLKYDIAANGAMTGSMIFDNSGNLYVAVINSYNGSSYNIPSYVYKITPDGIVTTVASQVMSYANGARGTKLLLDSVGNLYWAVVGYQNGTNTGYIYKITPQGVYTTFASTTLSGSTSCDLIFDSNENLYWGVAEYQGFNTHLVNSRVFKITPSGTLTTFATVATEGAFGTSLVFDSAGNLYWGIVNLYDQNLGYNSKISYVYKITPNGSLSTFASQATLGASDTSLVFDSSGNLYWGISSVYNGSTYSSTSYVYKVTPGGSLTTFASQATIGSYSTSLKFDSAGDLYWALGSHTNGTIFNLTSYVYKITPSGVKSTIASQLTNGAMDVSLIFNSTNDLYWGIANNYNGSSYSVTYSINILYKKQLTRNIAQSLTSSPSTIKQSISANGAQYTDFVFDSVGNLYWAVTNRYNGSTTNNTNYVYKLTTTGTLTTFASTVLQGATGTALAVDSSNNIYWAVISNWNQSTYNLTSYVYKITPGGSLTTFVSQTTSGAQDTDLIFDSAGNLYWAFANQYNGTTYNLASYIIKITPGGTATTFAAVATTGAVGTALQFDNSGNLYWAVTNWYNGTTYNLTSYIYKITPDETLTTFVSLPTTSALGTALTFDTSGNLYWAIMNYYDGTKYELSSNVYKITPNGTKTTFASQATIGSYDTDLVFDSSGDLYWAVTNNKSSTTQNLTSYVYKISADGTKRQVNSQSTVGVLGTALIFDNNDTLYWSLCNYYDNFSGNYNNTYTLSTQANKLVSKDNYFYTKSIIKNIATTSGANDTDLVMDSAGNVYWAVGNYYNGSYTLTSYVYKMTPNGTITTVAAQTTNGCTGVALAVDANDNIFWATSNYYNGSTFNLTSYVYKITPSGTVTTFASAATNAGYGTSLKFDTSGNLYWAVNNYYNGSTYNLTSYVYKITPGGSLTTFASTATSGAVRNALVFDTSGNLYWAVMNSYNGSTYNLTSYVYKITPGGTLTTLASTATSGGHGCAIIFDTFGTLYWAVMNSYNGSTGNLTSYIYKINTTTLSSNVFNSKATIGGLGTDLIFDTSGNLYWSYINNISGGATISSYVHRITPTGISTLFTSQETNAGINTTLLMDSKDNLYMGTVNYYNGSSYNINSYLTCQYKQLT